MKSNIIFEIIFLFSLSSLITKCQSERDPVLKFEDSAYALLLDEDKHNIFSSSSPFFSSNWWWWFDDIDDHYHYYTNSNDIEYASSSNSTSTRDEFLPSSFPCQPRNIHLSLGDTTVSTTTTRDLDDASSSSFQSKTTAMRLSFSIPKRLDSFCNPDQVNVRIEYTKLVVNNKDNVGANEQQNYQQQQQHDRTSTTSSSTIMDICVVNDKDSWTTNADDVVIRQYDTTSPITLERYSSDYIYHVALDDLEGDSEYSYTISVQARSSSTSLCRIMKRKSYNHVSSSSNIGKNGHLRGTITTHGMALEGDEKDSILLVERRNLMNQPQPFTEMSARTRPVTFRTPPMDVSDSGERTPVKFAIVGDLGQTYNSTVTMLNILSNTMVQQQTQKNNNKGTDQSLSSNSVTQIPVSALLIAGDMSYANSIQPQWDNWFNLIQPIASRIPMMVAAGNHEIECDAETFVPFLAYENRFYMPNRIQEAEIDAVEERYRNGPWGCATPSEFLGKYDYGNAYYSFDYGMIKTIVLSSYSDTRKGSIQYNWLVEELKSVDRKKHPWLLVMMHTQFYTTFQAHNNEEQTTIMREAMEELFLVHGINFVFSGHDHAYMRSKPMFRGQVVENGKAPIYIIVGEGGNREGHVKNYLHPDPEEWVAVRDKTVYGFGTLEVFNATMAQWKWNMGGLVNDFSDDVFFTNPYM